MTTHTMRQRISDFVSQSRWAVVGFSEDPRKFGHRIFFDMQGAGYQVYPVNRRGGVLAGETVYPSLSEIPDPVDVVDVVVPPRQALRVVHECVRLGIDRIWLQPGAESTEVLELCRKHGLQVVYNACAMVEKRVPAPPPPVGKRET